MIDWLRWSIWSRMLLQRCTSDVFWQSKIRLLWPIDTFFDVMRVSFAALWHIGRFFWHQKMMKFLFRFYLMWEAKTKGCHKIWRCYTNTATFRESHIRRTIREQSYQRSGSRNIVDLSIKIPGSTVVSHSLTIYSHIYNAKYSYSNTSSIRDIYRPMFSPEYWAYLLTKAA